VNSIWFNTTVAGKVVVEYANTGNNAARTVVVNSTADTGEATNNKDYVTSQEVAVEAGPVLISGKEVASGDAKMLRIRKVTFTATPSAVVEVKGAAGAQAAAVKKYFKDGKLIIEGADGSKFNAAGVQTK
jgi:hypothetical protein